MDKEIGMIDWYLVLSLSSAIYFTVKVIVTSISAVCFRRNDNISLTSIIMSVSWAISIALIVGG